MSVHERPGANAMNDIHVKDCAMDLFSMLQAALEGRADEGSKASIFAASTEHQSHIPMIGRK
ncbi:hypothetical protein BU15DRAFT_74258 [Melanogaster broomeanus]|nr:hypothetical protein BU15DRAFT_74258 [Melanogaster broomeanus]